LVGVNLINDLRRLRTQDWKGLSLVPCFVIKDFFFVCVCVGLRYAYTKITSKPHYLGDSSNFQLKISHGKFIPVCFCVPILSFSLNSFNIACIHREQSGNLQ